MPVTVSDIAKQAKISHMLGIIAHRIADLFYSKVQGGFETVAYSLIIDDSFLHLLT